MSHALRWLAETRKTILDSDCAPGGLRRWSWSRRTSDGASEPNASESQTGSQRSLTKSLNDGDLNFQGLS